MVTISLTMMVACLWAMYCNLQTAKDRFKLTERITPSDPNWREKFDEIDQISYEKHFLHRFFFLDPKDLYTLNK